MITKKQKEGTINEQIASDIKLILEFVSIIPKIDDRLKNVETDVIEINDNVEALKVGHKILHEDIKDFKKDLKQKVDSKEFNDLKRQVVKAA